MIEEYKEDGLAKDAMSRTNAGAEPCLSISGEAQALAEKILSLRRFGSVCGRTVMEDLLPRLGSPERGMRIVHIAGTNGKGSSAAFLAAVLQEARERVGLFTSPHLVRFSERIRVDGVPISDEAWLRLGRQVLETPCRYERTMFDCCLAIALLYFREKGCSWVVLETGLGGEKDATAGLSQVPEISLITRIGLDHTAVLGETLSEIAANKAGILKTGTAAVLAQMDAEALAVLTERCETLGIPWQYVSDPEETLRSVAENGSFPQLGLIGSYQRENAAAAVLAARLALSDILFTEQNRLIASGLAAAFWPGRMERLALDKGGVLLLDGAHNPQGMGAFVNSAQELWPGKKFPVLTGMNADKDCQKMVRLLAPICSCAVCTAADSERALPPGELARLFEDEGVDALTAETPEEGLGVIRSRIRETAPSREKAFPDTPSAVVCGSLYLIGTIRGSLQMDTVQRTGSIS